MLLQFIFLFSILTLLPNAKCMDVVLHNYNVSDGKGSIMDSNHSIIKIPGGYGVKASIRLKQDYGNNNKYLIKVEHYRNGKLKPLLLLPGKGGCESLNTYLGTYWKILERMFGIKDPGRCPIPKGLYSHNQYVNVTVNQFKHLLKLVPPVRGIVRVASSVSDLNKKLLAYIWGEGELIYD